MALMIKSRYTDQVLASGEEGDDTVRLLEGNWYFDPKTVDMTNLTVTERTYTCPYKGVCHWVDMETDEGTKPNVAFIYSEPMAGYEFIKDRVAFYGRDTSNTIALVEENTQV